MLSNPAFRSNFIILSKPFFALMSLCLLASSLTVSAESGRDSISDISIAEGLSNIEVQQADGQWKKPGSEELVLPTVVRTQDKGRAVITQGDTSITLNPGTELSLSSSSSRAKKLISLIKQRIGSAIYKVEKHPGDFTVETPYLVSVVKGTRFSVVTDSRDSLVTVTEGLVEVRDLRSGENNMVRPGEIIRSARSGTDHARARDNVQAISDPNSASATTSNSDRTPAKQDITVNEVSEGASAPVKISIDNIEEQRTLSESRSESSTSTHTSETRKIDSFDAARNEFDTEAKSELSEITGELNISDTKDQRFEANDQQARDTNSYENKLEERDQSDTKPDDTSIIEGIDPDRVDPEIVDPERADTQGITPDVTEGLDGSISPTS